MSFKNLIKRSLYKQYKVINFASIAVESKKYNGHTKDRNGHRKYYKTAAAIFSSVIVGSVAAEELKSKSKREVTPEVSPENVKKFEAGEKREDLPTFRADEVSKHDDKSSLWVTYRHGVYDVTSFLASHPGGEQILNAAGLSIEPFWNVYGMHNTDEIYHLLESFRIGNLHDEDVVDHSDDEMWVKEPRRDSRLIVKTAKPFNAETPPQVQVDHFDTPNELFYVRQHMPVPELPGEQHSLRVEVHTEGRVVVRAFTLDHLHQLPRASVHAALMCAGNRRSEMNKVKPVKGISWAGGAVSNALWAGVSLRALLRDCGLGDVDPTGKHVIFTGADIDATGEKFSTSIPLQMAMDRNARVLLATHMNGRPLPPDHGYPLRVVVPGAPAVRSVKWLESITVSERESSSHWHQKDYRAFNPSTTWDSANFATAPPVYSLPVTSAICTPADGEVVAVDGHLTVRGYAYSGGGAKVLRVDVSGDGGASWTEAQCEAGADPPQQHYAWTLWTARLPLHCSQDEVEVWVKATDSNFNTQPEKFDDIWNIRGILNNAYHRVTVRLQHRCRPGHQPCTDHGHGPDHSKPS